MKSNKLIAQLDASRYSIETAGGIHKVFDNQPTQGAERVFESPTNMVGVGLPENNPFGENIPLADMAHPLSEEEQETNDRRAVNDAQLGMPARLAALNRLNTRKMKK